ncbi:hypothetical protein XELAEV_18007095mg [Xenopus laevis]|uniref:Immunoglobulin V-set domain-containing protein n=1 Tax=Xenopus laevis TaxID=8355 RepID=A0A974DZU3_XENLA|nr:hypothetical protein XELAEV_18007095mg [Xenopus laevis]
MDKCYELQVEIKLGREFTGFTSVTNCIYNMNLMLFLLSFISTLPLSGALITDGSKIHAVDYIRQFSGTTFEFLAHINYAAGTALNPDLKSRLTLSRDTAKNEAYLEISGMTAGDTAMYYCAKHTVCDKLKGSEQILLNQSIHSLTDLLTVVNTFLNYYSAYSLAIQNIMH